MAESVNTLSLFQTKKYEEFFPNIPVLTEQNFFVQFNAYDVYLPKAWLGNALTSGTRNASLLNIFELSVLRLLSVNHFTVEDIGEKLCLKSDLIKFILQRLMDMNLIDENRILTDEGNQVLGNTSKATTDEQCVPVLMLVSRDNQRLMPIIFPKDGKVTGELVKPYISITFGSVGKGKTLKGRCIFVKEQGKRASRLEQAQIIDAIKAFNCKLPRDKKIRYNTNINIVSTYDAPIFLHSKGVLQDGYIDHMVTSDGSSLHNDFLREYIERQKNDVFQKLKEKAVKIVSTKQKKQKPQGKYSEIKKAMEREQSNITNVDELKRAESKERQLVGNLIKAIEWALLYHLRQFPPPPEIIRALSLQTPQENALTILNFAEQLGLSDAKTCPQMFAQVTRMAVMNCLNTENPTLAVHLSVNIAAAAKVPDSRLITALNTLSGTAKNQVTGGEDLEAENDKVNAFIFLNRLDRYGKEIRHSDEWHPVDGDNADKLYIDVVKFIEALLPDYDNPSVVNDPMTNVSLQKLSAELVVCSTLGEDIFRSLPEDVREQLLKICSDKWGGQMLPSYEFVGVLSIILEKIFYNLLQEMPTIVVSKSEIVARLRRNGIADDLGTVGEVYYDRACQKRKATLGAYTLAYMAALNDDDLCAFTEHGIHDLTHKITGYRGHGNRMGLVVDKDVLFTLRKEVFETIKFLGGSNK